MAQTLSGAGVGLRSPHIREVISRQPDIPWLEVHTCNYLGGGLNRLLLSKIREHYPLSFHGVNLNLGGVDPLDKDYLSRLVQICRELEPSLISEHACFTSLHNQHFHDLLPIPYTREALALMGSRVNQVQEALGREILIENVSRYASFPESEMSEGEFLAELCQSTGCGLLLDLNNAYVNQQNLGISVQSFLQQLPLERVAEIHLAGFSENSDGWLVDTHASPICEPVWQLFENTLEQLANIPCLIERDSNIPELDELLAERNRAQQIIEQAREQPQRASL